MNRCCLTVSATLVFCASTAWAQPYQFEIRGAFAQINISQDDSFFDDFETDSLLLQGRYYLQIVDQSTGPLAERAFLDKAASVGLTYNLAEPEVGDSVDSLGIDARFVTLTDTIFELEYSKTDSPSGDDLTEYRLGAGKYTDNGTTVLGTFKRDNFDNVNLDVLSVELRKVEDAGAANTAIAYEGSLGLLRASDDAGNDENGFEFIGRFTYYTSEQFGFGGGLGYRDISDLDVTIVGVDVSYFFNDAVSVVAEFERGSTSFDVDTDTLGVVLAARF